MNRLLTVIISGLVIAGLLLVLPIPVSDSIPTRDPDIRPVVNIPENGGRYQKEMGLHVNVTLFNDGDNMGSSTGNLTLFISNLETGKKVPTNFFPIQFSGIDTGENRSFEFPNWTGTFPGRFIANISVQYLDDGNPGNNYVEHTFSIWSDEWQGRPELIPKQVKPIRGNTTTDFIFKSEFKFNKIPNWMKVQIDDQLIEMSEDDPLDDIPNDGKIYSYGTKLSIGNHRYRFFVNATGINDLTSPWTNSPWVNLSLKNVNITPKKGYVTTPFHFSVDYGSEKGFPPDSIYVDTGTRNFNLSRSSPHPDYQGARVEYSATIQGMDLTPSPVEFHVRCASDGESYSIGPFDLDGPSMVQANFTGTVTDLVGTPLQGVLVEVDPGSSTLTDANGDYEMVTNIGPRFQITYSKEGYLPRSYELDILEDRDLTIELEEVPVGGSISGYVKSPISGEIHVLEGAVVNISMMGYSNETISSKEGFFLMGGIPAGSSYTLRVSEFRHETTVATITIKDGEMTLKNVTLAEMDMEVSIDPEGSGEAIPVDQEFIIEFPHIPDMESVTIILEDKTSIVPITVMPIENSSKVKVSPIASLIYNKQYNLTLRSGIIDNITEEILVWRDLAWTFMTEMQSIGTFLSYPEKDSLDVPLNITITLSFGIGLNEATFHASLNNMDNSGEHVSINVWFNFTYLKNDSGRTDTVVKISTSHLKYSTRYSLEITPTLKDIYGRNVLEETLSIEFTTLQEPDSDDDGVVDSLDAFPMDPLEWSDFDEDGIGDNADKFPTDPSEWGDLDGDGLGDNADTDDDGDQIPDTWELTNGLDPTDPTDAFEDDDDDGYENIEEFLEDTDPQDKNDHPKGDTAIDRNLIIIGVAIFLIVVVVIVAILYMMGMIGRKKGESLEEE